MKKRNVVITGGSSGIGLELARLYARSNCNLILIARDLEKLRKVRTDLISAHPTISVEVATADVSNMNEVQGIVEQISAKVDSVDLLICSAGVMKCGRFEDQKPEESTREFDINYWGTHNIVYHFLPLLKSSEIARVGLISSVAGYTGLFGYTHYAPSKFALSGLAECLRMEFKDHRISISAIYPPDTETPFLEYERAHTLPECKALSAGAKSVTAVRAAKVIARGLDRRKFEIYFNFDSRMIRVLKGITPGLYYYLVDRIVRMSRSKNTL